ncbi:hypothetical protein O3P69_019901 [Scylla paramamosain]|uniref:Uncharacterized protein n=1 Tax=Scylla paramamosain TaxID=85552 RepID=A0AAW0SFL7_SCYPA
MPSNTRTWSGRRPATHRPLPGQASSHQRAATVPCRHFSSMTGYHHRHPASRLLSRLSFTTPPAPVDLICLHEPSGACRSILTTTTISTDTTDTTSMPAKRVPTSDTTEALTAELEPMTPKEEATWGGGRG